MRDSQTVDISTIVQELEQFRACESYKQVNPQAAQPIIDFLNAHFKDLSISSREANTSQAYRALMEIRSCVCNIQPVPEGVYLDYGGVLSQIHSVLYYVKECNSKAL